MSNFNIELNKLEQSNSELLNVANTYVSGQNTLAELVEKLNKAYEDLIQLSTKQPAPAEVEGEIFEFGQGLKTEFYNHRYKMDGLREQGYGGFQFPDDETEIQEIPSIDGFYQDWFSMVLPTNLLKFHTAEDNTIVAPSVNIPEGCVYFKGCLSHVNDSQEEYRVINIPSTLEYYLLGKHYNDSHPNQINLSEDNPYFEIVNNCLFYKFENNGKSLVDVSGLNSTSDFTGVKEIGYRWNDEMEYEKREEIKYYYLLYSLYYLNNSFNNYISFPDLEYVWDASLRFCFCAGYDSSNVTIDFGSNLTAINGPQAFRDFSGTIICRATTPPVCNGDGFAELYADSIVLKVPSESLSLYQNDEIWGRISNIQAIE